MIVEKLRFTSGILLTVLALAVMLPFIGLLVVEHAITHHVRKKKSWADQIQEEEDECQYN